MSKSGNTSSDLNLSKDSTKIKDKGKKGGPGMESLESGWKYETEYVFNHYEANSEFGIWPTNDRQYAGSSGDTSKMRKLNELKSKWGFNYISANIGDGQNISAIVSAGFSRTTNYMALLGADQAGRDAAANCCNGLNSNDYFWAYYTDEPYTEQSITQYDFKSFRDYVKGLHQNSLFGFGETYYVWANRYTHNPYLWADGQYYINYNPAQVDFVMCTRYISWSGTSIDQRSLWDGLQSIYNNVFARTWIAAHQDGSEFRNLLGYCRDQGYAPWFFQALDGYDYNDQMIASYCQAAWLEGFLERYDKQYLVLYRCILNHTHDPNAPWDCIWEEYDRTYIGMVQR